MLARFEARCTCCLLTEVKKGTDLMPEFRQSLKVD
jgi:hypothetical protein